jgi:tRNA(Ile)-lysidine synthase TilS/MesJ
LEATDDILERHPFLADETNIMKDPLMQTTEQFLKKHLQNSPYQSSPTSSTAFSASTSSCKPIIKNIIMISLSGGVDSMVLSKVLALLQKSKKVSISAIVAIHMDYANRPESSKEASYVKEWSESLNIHFRIRTVNEVTRGITDRDAYEKISRNIRYSFYQECISEALNGGFDDDLTEKGQGKNENREYHVSGILFGHHLGDVQENVISNVMR